MLAMLGGCVQTEKTKTDSLKIVTSFYPIMLLTKAVTFEAPNITVSNLTKPQTGCLHDYVLLPEDMKSLENADVFIINGLGMESFIDKVENTLPNLKIIDLSEGITPYSDNAHIWLSPANAVKMIENINSSVGKLSPQNTSVLNENSQKYIEKVKKLDAEIKSKMQSVQNRDIVTFHEAFTYFAKDFGLNVKTVIEREPGEEPTTQELKQTIDIVRNSNVKVLFVEPQYSSSAANVISGETGAKLYTLDPIVTGENTDDADKYLNKMYANLENIISALK